MTLANIYKVNLLRRFFKRLLAIFMITFMIVNISSYTHVLASNLNTQEEKNSYLIIEKNSYIPAIVHDPIEKINEEKIKKQAENIELFKKQMLEAMKKINAFTVERTVKIQNIVNSMTQSDWWALYHAVNAEGQPGCPDSHVGIAAVIFNRVMSPLFPNTVYDVIYQDNPTQFLVVENGTINKELQNGIKEAVQRAIEGEDPTFGSLYFLVPEKYGVTSGGKTPSVIIGKTQFYFSLKDELLDSKTQLLALAREFGLSAY